MLAGGGHTHCLLLRRWIMRPAERPQATLVVLVNRSNTALYSGMVPGLVAGLYARDACAIDLRDLCRRAGVVFLQAEITGLDPEAATLQLKGRPALRFDQLSLDVGCQTRGPLDGRAVGVKPLEPFLAWLEQRLMAPSSACVAIRGGGAAAVELALALRTRGLQPELLLRGDSLHLGSAAANRAGEQLLREAAIAVRRCVGPEVAAELACTGSEAPPWLAAAGLPVAPESGRVLTDASLRVLGFPALFGCGDCAQLADDPRPASGVWAVRAAPVLAENLRRCIDQPARPLRRWRPQRSALQLLGDGGWGERGPRAVAFRGSGAWGPSAWLWRWKDQIDRRFMAGFRSDPARDAMAQAGSMACRGCAAKLPARPLAAALGRLQPDAVAPPPDDAVPLERTDAGALLLQSVDGFPALLDDPWLNARLTTLHACSDLWACGARLHSLQALVTLPEMDARLQEEWLLQSLAGVRSVLDPLAVPLLGGHTLEGRDGAGLALALSVTGVVPEAEPWPKGPLQRGQVLLLSRPIGSGVLFAAAMAGACPPAWLDAALQLMQQSQAPLVELLAAHGCTACTDITGFGLLGHLSEMLAGAQRLELDPAAIPVLPGALELIEQGYASSLAPSNAEALTILEPTGSVCLRGPATAAQQQLWIDPQTCGPLLAALPQGQAAAALTALRAAGFEQASLIGRVL